MPIRQPEEDREEEVPNDKYRGHFTEDTNGTGEAYRHLVRPNGIDSHQTDPYWLAVVIPFAYKDTYNRTTKAPRFVAPVFELEKIIIDDDCINWSCSSSKSSHTSSLNLTLLPSKIDYTSKVAPEDWIIFWAFNNHTDYARIKKLIKEGSRANDFNSGLKFVGRVQTVFKSKNVDTSSGRKSVNYSLTAAGFSELDSSMYFDQTIELLRPDAAVSWANFADISNQFTKLEAGLIKSEAAIPFLLSVCFGCGPSEGSRTGGIGGDRSITPNESFLVPESILHLLMPADPKPFYKDVGFTYVDLLRVYMGTFAYSTSGFEPEIRETKSFVSFAYAPLTGVFPLQALNFNNQTIWEIVNTYCGQPMNEAFTCLRAQGQDRHILPTLIFRQLPLSSPQFVHDNIATSYLTVPRWVIDDRLVTNIQYGYSNSLRFNYMHLMPSNWANNEQSGKSLAAFLGDPITDSSDIKRAGLRAKIQTIGCTYEADTIEKAQTINQFYNKLMADILFGGHLKYTGTINCKGIQDPICEGDNCEADGILFHIERVMHSGGIDGSGQKEFNTVLHVGNGIKENSRRYGIPEDLAIADDVGNTVERG